MALKTWTVQDFIHKPYRHLGMLQPDHQNDPARCQFSVAEVGRVTNYHQCYKKVAEEIEGVGFCGTHAKKVKLELGIKQETYKRYAASFYWGSPLLVELDVASETQNMIEIISARVIIGSNYGLYPGSLKKNSHYTNKWTFFDDSNSAHKFLVEEAWAYTDSCRKELDKAIEVYEKLARKGL